MSDATAAAPAAPSDSAPTTPAPPPVDPRREHLDALDKHGGVEVKVGGKVVKMTTEQLIRNAQRGLPVEEGFAALSKQREELAPKLKLLEQLEKGNDDEQQEALEKLLGSKFVSAAEKRLIREMQKESKFEGMTERERQMAQQLEAANGEKNRLAEEKAAFEKAQRDAEESKEVAHWQNVFGGIAVGALKSLELPEKLEPLALKLVQPIMKELMSSGTLPTSEDLAQHIDEILSQLVDWNMKGARGEKALKRNAPALREYSRAQLAALSKGSGLKSAPVQSAKSEAAGSNGTKITPIWDPRKNRY